MSRILVATLLSVTFALQMLVAERGACDASGHGVTNAMTAMHMAAAAPEAVSSDGSTEARAPHPPPCDQPANPAACQLMAPCAASFIGVPAPALAAERPISPRVVPTGVLKPSSRTDPPDLPPPRA